MPKAGLNAAADEFNAGLALAGSANDARQPIRKGPFYALGPVQSWIVFTEGGLAVSREHQVVNGENVPVPGLYAAGSAGQGGC